MIRSLLNLRCRYGHRFYSPNPAAWINRECGYKAQPNDKGEKSCTAKLRRIR